jgi:hypothetical protein
MKATINAKGTEITVLSKGDENDFISLTDIARYKNPEFPADVVKNWLRTRSTIEFLGLWEQLNNPDFKLVEFDQFKNEAGANAFVLNPQKWISATNAVGMLSKSGRYGGTFAHKDIAFEFASWVSVEFKLYIIKDYQRLKADENSRISLEWNVNRVISKINYKIHTDAIKDNLIPHLVSNSNNLSPTPAKRICSMWPCSARQPENGKNKTQRQRVICGTRQPFSNSLSCPIWKA